VNGDTTLDIFSGVDSETAESILPITGSTASARPSAQVKSGNPRRPQLRHKRYQIPDVRDALVRRTAGSLR